MNNKILQELRNKDGDTLRSIRNSKLLSAREISELSNGMLTIKTIYKFENGYSCSHDTYLIYKQVLDNL